MLKIKTIGGVVVIMMVSSGCYQVSQNEAPSPNPIFYQKPIEQKPIKIQKWALPDVPVCKLKLVNNIKSLPHDIVISAQRSNLNRYDGLSSHRPWLITSRLELFEFGSSLIDEGKEGQIYFSLAAVALNENAVYFNKTWEDPQHGMEEIAYEGISMDERFYRSDVLKINFDDGSVQNLTANSPSFYNAGAFPYLNEILFTAIMGGDVGRTYSVQIDGTNIGTNIQPFVKTPGYAYGMAISPDGTKYAFHADYKVYIGDMTTKNEIQVVTPYSFNFAPKWSKDSQKIVFKSGRDNEHPDLWVADRDGSNVHLLSNFGGYNSAVAFIEGYDFHDGGSDRIIVSSSGAIHGKKIGTSIELVLAKFDGTQIQLTHTVNGQNTYPELSKDGWLLFNQKIGNGPMNLLIMNLNDNNPSPIQVTDMDEHCNTRFGFWK